MAESKIRNIIGNICVLVVILCSCNTVKAETTDDPAAIVFHIEDPIMGKTEMSLGSDNAPSVEDCKTSIKSLQDELFADLKKNAPVFKNAKLIYAECVKQSEVEPEKIERPDGYVGPIVSMALKLMTHEPSVFFFPAPIEGMSLAACNEFIGSEESAANWIKFAHSALKARSPGMFDDSEVIEVACLTPTKEMLNTIQGK